MGVMGGTAAKWEIPGGGAEPGDADLAHTAARETAEELGLDQAVVRPLAEFVRANPHCVEIEPAYTVWIVKVRSFEFRRPPTPEMREFRGFRLWEELTPFAAGRLQLPLRDRDAAVIKKGIDAIWLVAGNDTIPEFPLR
jgi:8-oxo-dGTP pyrophosphatase MutT (NUDIX family)